MPKIYDTLTDVFVSLTEIELNSDMDWEAYAELGQNMFNERDDVECLDEEGFIDY